MFGIWWKLFTPPRELKWNLKNPLEKEKHRQTTNFWVPGYIVFRGVHIPLHLFARLELHRRFFVENRGMDGINELIEARAKEGLKKDCNCIAHIQVLGIINLDVFRPPFERNSSPWCHLLVVLECLELAPWPWHQDQEHMREHRAKLEKLEAEMEDKAIPWIHQERIKIHADLKWVNWWKLGRKPLGLARSSHLP